MRVFEGEYLATKLRIEYADEYEVAATFRQMHEYLTDFDARYSRFRSDNWLAGINASGGGVLDAPATEMLSVALTLAEITEGAFDPTITPDLERIGYARGTPCAEGPERTSYRDVRLVWNALTLVNWARIEFGGVGKWYTLEHIVRLFGDCPQLLINFGGDIYARGEYEIALANPLDPTEAIGVARVRDTYICGSSGVYRKFEQGHHLLDGQTGQSANVSLASWVVGASGIWTDALATALYILGVERWLELLTHPGIPLGCEGAVLSPDFTLHSTNTKVFQGFRE